MDDDDWNFTPNGIPRHRDDETEFRDEANQPRPETTKTLLQQIVFIEAYTN